MKKVVQLAFLFTIINILFALESKASEVCDSLRWCIGRTLQFTISSGKAAQYADITNNNLLKKLDETMTVEMWLKPQKQGGFLQYICGLWGPGSEKNDSWVVYISQSDSLTFELNGSNNLGTEDNTFVKIPAAGLYNKWNHFSFVFNGKTGYAYILINAVIIDSARNNLYPLSHLKKLTNNELSIQLGSTNAFSNNTDVNRTFLGSMDEIRIWGKVLSDVEINCLKDLALTGKEDSLLLYYRCNDPAYIYTICDASGHNNFGFIRSGLSTAWSDRADIIKTLVTPNIIKDTLYCDNEKIYDFVITDTSLCSAGAYIRANTGMPDKFRLLYNNKETSMLNWSYIPLSAKLPVNFQIKVKGDFIGTITTRIEVRNNNSCGYSIKDIPITITRMTELNISKLSINFDSLKAGCIERFYIDSVIKICNNTAGINSKDIIISDLKVNQPNVYVLNNPALPDTLKPGACININVRFYSGGKAANYYDTLKITSTDKCSQISKIPLNGRVCEVIGIYKSGTKTRLDTINFGQICINFPSDPIEYSWEDLIGQDIIISNIKIPQNFIGKRFTFPVTLKAVTGYLPNYFRFFPKQKGVFKDSIIFVIKSDGCTIYRPIYITGTGYDAAISFASSTVNFNTILVGKEQTLNVQVKNDSQNPLSASIYLKQGDPFSIIGAKSITIPAFSTSTFPLNFKPSRQGMYYDEICIYENSCFQSYCIPVIGNAIIKTFEYSPEVMEVLNVIGCQSKDTALEIKNISGITQVLTNFSLTPAPTPFILLNPLTLPLSITLNNNEKVTFKFRYSPNDLVNDMSDKAFLNYQTSNGENWSAKLHGTSIIPKLFLNDEILYNTIEVGATQRDTLTLENISLFDIYIDSLSVGNGFKIIYPANFTGKLLKPRDSIQIIVDFMPTENKLYSSELVVNSSKPCNSVKKAKLEGRGLIIPLDAPLKVISYGFVKPCECQVRTIPLINNSFTFGMSIDSVWIDSLNVTNQGIDYYSWYSFLSPKSTTPYFIPARSTDTLSINFCPRRPLIYKFVDNDARLHIKASGSGWNNEFTTYLAGKQTLLMVADTQRITFTPTRVDTFAKSQYFHIKIPDISFNPQRATVKISKLGFNPEEIVFFASDSLNKSLPLVLDTSGKITVKMDFKPRAVRYYEEKFKVDIETPCSNYDTSITVSGSGFAPAFGFNFGFGQPASKLDTFRFVPCDTLKIPVYSSRQIPANVIDINCRLGYDTTKLEYAGYESAYLNNPCPGYIPSINQSFSKYGGSQFLLKNFCSPDSIKPIFIAKFIAKSSKRDTLDITVDSLSFDTQDVILFHLIVETDKAKIIILQPGLKAINSINFDSVKVLDCAQRTIELKNTGDVPLNLFSVLNLPKEIKIISFNPPSNGTLAVGDTVNITLEFCPRTKVTINNWVSTLGSTPCSVLDSNQIFGLGYAPEFNFIFDISYNFSSVDTITSQIGDTLTIPIINNKDFSGQVKSGVKWLEKLNFKNDFGYNPFALKFLAARNFTNSNFRYYSEPGKIRMEFNNTDSLKSGKMAELVFLTIIPDSIKTSIYIYPYNFNTDSIIFLDIIPKPSKSILVVSGKCNLINLNFHGVYSILEQNNPNPYDKSTTINFSISEKTPVIMNIYSINGELVKGLIEGTVFIPGNYSIHFNADKLKSGVYFYILRTNNDYHFKSMLIIK
ncbi:MAG: choice-of-anchor D domain-containing protein [Candidatus Kapabacteria bacterium]|nr:choice-of-anchor D domain-containing protein [Candidatus Kapabacteria bacterium]